MVLTAETAVVTQQVLLTAGDCGAWAPCDVLSELGELGASPKSGDLEAQYVPVYALY